MATYHHPRKITAAEFTQLCHGRRVGRDKYVGHCPGPLHRRGDRNGSLSITQGKDGVIFKCFVGCDPDDIVQALGVRWVQLFDDDLPLRPIRFRNHIRAPRPLTELRDLKREHYEQLRRLYRETAASFRWLARQVECGELEWVSLWCDDDRALDDLHRELCQLEREGYRA